MPDFNLLTAIIQNYGYSAIFLASILEGACMPIASELVLGFAGLLVYKGQLSFWGAVSAGWFGSLIGAFIIYSAARYGGRKFIYKWGHVIHLTPIRIDTFTDWFNKNGAALIIPWKLLPVIRAKISIAAGLLRMNKAVFLLYTATGIAVWSFMGVSLGAYLGDKWPVILELIPRLGKISAAVAALTAFGVAYLIYTKTKVKQA